jgi:hypothetical protein
MKRHILPALLLASLFAASTPVFSDQENESTIFDHTQKLAKTFSFTILKDTEFSLYRIDSTDFKMSSFETINSSYLFISKNLEEVSIFAESGSVSSFQEESGEWSIIYIDGTIPPEATGILCAITTLFFKAGVSVFACSTFDTDYFFVKKQFIEQAVQALREAGFKVAIN